MGADYPDWGGQYNSGAFFPLFDMAELAVRLGSPVSYDRRGAVTWLENFFYGIVNFTIDGDGAGITTELSAAKYQSPPFSALLYTEGAVDDYVRIYRKIALPSTGKVGFACTVNWLGPLNTISLRVRVSDGENEYEGRVDLVNTLSYALNVVHAGGTTDIWDKSFVPLFGSIFQFVKLVVDLDTMKFERFILDRTEYDLSAYGLVNNGETSQQYMEPEVRYTQESAGTGRFHLDTLIATGLEPPN